MSSLHLLPRESLVVTNELDKGDWTYQPLLGSVMRLRFRGVVAALAGRPRSRRLLEVGYGSGLFLPELARHADHVHGIDVHPEAAAVRRAARGEGIATQLLTGSVTALPYADESFDAVVVVSALEFVDDIATAASELARVLTPTGALVVVTPGSSPILDLGLRVLTRGEKAEDTFEGRRDQVVPTLTSTLRLTGEQRLPKVIGAALPFYRVLTLQRRA